MIWKMQELFIIPGFLLVRLFQQLLLILGRMNSACVFVRRSQIHRREAGTAPHPSPEVKGLTQSEVAASSGYPA